MYYLDAKRLAAEAIQRAERAEQQIEEAIQRAERAEQQIEELKKQQS